MAARMVARVARVGAEGPVLTIEQTWGVLLIVALCPAIGALPLAATLARWWPLSRSLATIEPGPGLSLRSIALALAEGAKGIAVVALARQFFPAGSAWELLAVAATILGRYWAAAQAETRIATWGAIAHEPVAAALTWFLSFIGFTIVRDRRAGRLVVLVVYPALLGLLHPAQGDRVIAAMVVGGLLAWLYQAVPEGLGVTELPTAGDRPEIPGNRWTQRLRPDWEPAQVATIDRPGQPRRSGSPDSRSGRRAETRSAETRSAEVDPIGATVGAPGQGELFDWFRGDRSLLSLNDPLVATTVGDKAARLSQLKRWGYPVLPGWIVLPGDDVSRLVEFWAKRRPDGWLVFDPPLLVRSSALLGRERSAAPSSDSPADRQKLAPSALSTSPSSAGQYLSIPDLQTPEDLVAAIAAAFESIDQPHVWRYRRDFGYEPAANVALLIQPQVAGAFSGVAFSRDPDMRAGSAVAIEALPGSAAQALSGEITPERYQVFLPDGPGDRSAADRPLPPASPSEAKRSKPGQPTTIDREPVAPSPEQVRLIGGQAGNEDGLEDGDVPHWLLLEVARLVRELEERSGGVPQAIDWTFDGDRLWILQNQPLDALWPIWRRSSQSVTSRLTGSLYETLAAGPVATALSQLLGDRPSAEPAQTWPDLIVAHQNWLYWQEQAMANLAQATAWPIDLWETVILAALSPQPLAPPDRPDLDRPVATVVKPGFLAVGRHWPLWFRLWRSQQDWLTAFNQADEEQFTPALLALNTSNPIDQLCEETPNTDSTDSDLTEKTTDRTDTDPTTEPTANPPQESQTIQTIQKLSHDLDEILALLDRVLAYRWFASLSSHLDLDLGFGLRLGWARQLESRSTPAPGKTRRPSSIPQEPTPIGSVSGSVAQARSNQPALPPGEAGRSLQYLARQIRDLWDKQPNRSGRPQPATFLTDLARTNAGCDLLSQLGAWFDRFGHLNRRDPLGWAGTDLNQPTWREDPDAVRSLLFALVTETDRPIEPAIDLTINPTIIPTKTNPSEPLKTGLARLDDLYAQLLAHLRWRCLAIDQIRHQMSRPTGRDRSWLATPADLFNLDLDAIRQGLDRLAQANPEFTGPIGPESQPARPKAQDLDQDSGRSAEPDPTGETPPDRLYGPRTKQDSALGWAALGWDLTSGQPTRPNPPAIAGRLQGMGIVPGCVEGRAVLIRSLTQLIAWSDQEDDIDHPNPTQPNRSIVIVHHLDPTWLPRLSRAAGLIAEVGGRLSAGAIVAREYGLPTVCSPQPVAIDPQTTKPNSKSTKPQPTNTNHPRQHLHAGQRLRLNGDTGLIEVLA